MASELHLTGLSEADLAGLSDFELVEGDHQLTAAIVAAREAHRRDEGDSEPVERGHHHAAFIASREGRRREVTELFAHPSTEALTRLRLSRQEESRRLACLGRIRREMGRRLGLICRASRLASGLSVREAADRLGVSDFMIRLNERGDHWTIAAPLFAKISLEGGLEAGEADSVGWRFAPLLSREPCRPLAVGPIEPSWLSWNDGVVSNLSRKIQAERAFDLLPILGDALEEAGCDAAEVLSHCRERAEHIRACRVVGGLLMAALPQD